MIRLAFLFRVETAIKGSPKFFVKITRCHTYCNARVGWMDDDNLPEFDDATQTGTLAPDVDITEECHEFSSEVDAITFMALHYKSELEKLPGSTIPA